MFAKRGNPTGVRKRTLAAAEAAEAEPAQGAAAAAPAAPAASATKSSNDGSDEEHASIVKRKNTRPCKYYLMGRTKDETTRQRVTDFLGQPSKPELDLDNDCRATATFEVDTEKDRDHRSIMERNLKISDMIEKGELESGVYRGLGAYRRYVKPSEGALSRAKTTGLYGPVRGQSHIRMTMYVDLNPEICKDYKETGYCGYGDCCKFLHDRTDYKGGWQVEKEWQEKKRREEEKLRRKAEGALDCTASSDSDSSSSESESDEDGLPQHCLNCKKKWSLDMNPVMTKCGHCFCETCALSIQPSGKCLVCQESTHGILNAAWKLISELEKKEKQKKMSNNSNDGGADNKSDGTSSDKDSNSDDDDDDNKNMNNMNNGKPAHKHNGSCCHGHGTDHTH